MKRTSSSFLLFVAVLTISLLTSTVTPLAVGQGRDNLQSIKPSKESADQPDRLKEEGSLPQSDGIKVRHKKPIRPDPIEEDDPDVPRMAQGSVNRPDYLTC